MRWVSEDNRGTENAPSRRARWVFAAVVLAAGWVPMIHAASAAGSTAAAPACAGATYTVVGGDSWTAIARRSSVKLTDLLSANNATTATAIHPGQTLCLPAGASAVPTTAPPPTTTVPPVAAPTTTPTAAPAVVPIEAFPVQGICSFGDSYGAPRSGGRKHEGVDIMAKAGNWIYAVKDGTLTKQFLDAPGSLSGNGWRLTAADGTYFFYAHLGTFAAGLSVGSAVKAGQIIGQVGMTGSASAPHLHFEVHPGGGAPVNPTPTATAADACASTAVLPQPSGAIPGVVVPGVPAPAPAPAPVPAPAPAPVPAPVPPPAPAPTGGGRWQFIASVAALDTAAQGKPLTPGAPATVRVDGLAGVPAGTAAVLIRISTRNAVGTGYLLAHPCDAPLGSSTLNFSPAARANGVAAVRVVNGSICVTVSQKTHVRMDVIAVAASQGVGPVPMVTSRALDTRLTARPAAGAKIALTPVALGVPAGSKALSATITVVDPPKGGTVAIGACSGGGWSMPFSRQPVASYSVVIRINDSGLCLTPSIATHLLVDVTAAWTTDGAMSPVNPTRLFDARTGSGTIGVTPTPIAVAGIGGVPANATTALLNVTIVGGVGFVFPCDQPVPAASAVSAAPGIVSAGVVPVRLAGGAACVSTFAPVPVVVDVIGAG